MAAKFEVVQSGSGYRWVLKSQGRTVAIGATYQRRALAEKAIASFRMAAIAAPVDDQTPTRGKPAPAKAARAAGRAVGKTVGTGAAAVEKLEKTTKRVAKKAAKVVDAAAPTAKKAAGRKRATKG